MLLILEAIQVFMVPTVVRSHLKCSNHFSGWPRYISSLRPLCLHGICQAYNTQWEPRLNISSRLFSGSLQQMLAEDADTKYCHFYILIQSFVARQDSKYNTNSNHFCRQSVPRNIAVAFKLWKYVQQLIVDER